MHENSAIRILVLDDNSFELKLLGHMLTALGFPPANASDSGRAALDWIDRSEKYPDLILLDLNMPEMDGVEFLHHLAERHYTGSLILVSGEDERVLRVAENLVHAHQIILLGSLHKPVTQEGLAALIGTWSPPSQYHSPQTEIEVYAATELRSAITNGELVNYYQPKVDIATGRMVGAEALVRWQHPHGGMVLPGQFIGVAEQHGLIDDLTHAVLSEAFAQASLWQESGLVLQLAVNVSIDNLASPKFVDFIADLAATANVPPQLVVLEVTESRMMLHDLRAPLETLTRLRLKRFRLSIDDFGTGHSSLAQLRDIPFDELKIDQGFVHRASSDGMVRAKYEACLSIARQLGMEVVAEGVEDRDDWDFLRRSGCDLAQGYFIAKPMPATSLPGWKQEWQANVRKNFTAS